MYECHLCKKKYKRESNYKIHLLECKLSNEQCKIPSNQDLYAMLIIMQEKYNKLEKKYDKLHSWVENKRKRVNVIHWLNESYKLKHSFNNLCDSITLTKEHLNYVFKYNYIEGIYHIIQDILPLIDENNLSIKAFDQKENTLFIFNNNKWDIMTNIEIEKFINIISKQLMNNFIQWQNENKSKMNQERFTDIYLENVQKVIGGNLTKEKIFQKIKKILYKHVKMDLKNIIEYEFGYT